MNNLSIQSDYPSWLSYKINIINQEYQCIRELSKKYKNGLSKNDFTALLIENLDLEMKLSFRTRLCCFKDRSQCFVDSKEDCNDAHYLDELQLDVCPYGTLCSDGETGCLFFHPGQDWKKQLENMKDYYRLTGKDGYYYNSSLLVKDEVETHESEVPDLTKELKEIGQRRPFGINVSQN